MIFNSLTFAIFFALTYATYLLIHKRIRLRNAFLLCASYLFYGWWDWRFLSLILVSTFVDYAVGRLMTSLDPQDPQDSQAPRKRTRLDRFWLICSLVTNLGILGFFKYFNFFIHSFSDLLESIGLAAHTSSLNIVLPIGISFYTFQTLSYSIDLYRGKIRAERSFLNFAVYVSFFPQLVAGPIERAAHLLPQFRTVRPLSSGEVSSGFFLIWWGMFKKVVIADNIAHVANTAFAATSPTGFDVMVGVYAFAIQIYCDFSGYSDIARGTARCLGFDLMLNFNLPYFATNPQDFWRRWHISLSTWLRDYLYISLGGSRGGRFRTSFNLMLTMVLGGLWHGAAWTFVAWGFFHGLVLILHRSLAGVLSSIPFVSRPGIAPLWFWFRVFVFFHIVCFSWLLFRAESIGQAWQMLCQIPGFFLDPRSHIDHAALDWRLIETFMGCASIFFIVQLVQWRTQNLYFVLRLNPVFRALIYAALWLGLIMFGEFNGQDFIYFQF